MTTATIRNKLYDYIRVANDKKLHAIYNLLEGEIDVTTEWWNNKEFMAELDRRYEAVESGEDKGFTIDELKASIEKHKQRKHAK